MTGAKQVEGRRFRGDLRLGGVFSVAKGSDLQNRKWPTRDF